MPDQPFQLKASDFKTGNFLVDGAVKKGIEAVNKLDLNKNKVPDIQEAALLGAKLVPALVALNAAVDFDKLAEELAEHPSIKDHALFAAALRQLGELAEQAGSLLPHHDD